MTCFNISRRAPAAANYGAKVGFVVKDHTVAGECILAGAAAAGENAKPLGVIVEAEDRLGGLCTITIFGTAYFFAGGVITKGTHTILKTDAASELVAAADADAVWTTGFVLFEGETAAAADGGMYRMFVDPKLIEV